jgi:hypothetical protein
MLGCSCLRTSKHINNAAAARVGTSTTHKLLQDRGSV